MRMIGGPFASAKYKFYTRIKQIKKCTDYSRCSVPYWEYERGIRKTKEDLKIVIS